VTAGGKALEVGEGVLEADEAASAARKAGAEDLVAELTGIVPVEHDPPRLDVASGVTQRREGDADLERPALGGDLALGLPEEVGGAVLVVRGVVLDGVVLDAARVGEEEDPGAAVVAGVEDDAPVVRGRRHVVPVVHRRADRSGIGILEAEARVQAPVVVGEVADALHLRRDVVAGVRLVPRVDGGDAAPPFVVEVAVHDDAAGRADGRERGHGLLGAGVQSDGQQEGRRREGAKEHALSLAS
jgi:hypothetical protein